MAHEESLKQFEEAIYKDHDTPAGAHAELTGTYRAWI